MLTSGYIFGGPVCFHAKKYHIVSSSPSWDIHTPHQPICLPPIFAQWNKWLIFLSLGISCSTCATCFLIPHCSPMNFGGRSSRGAKTHVTALTHLSRNQSLFPSSQLCHKILTENQTNSFTLYYSIVLRLTFQAYLRWFPTLQ